MKVKLILPIMLLAGMNLVAQQKFEKGYYIMNDSTRVECLIRERGLSKCPQDFTCRLSDTSATVTGDAILVKEFGIYGGYRYVSEEVMIDLSCDDEKSLSEEANPVWHKSRLFLQVLIDGKASLYFYRDPVMVRYFYRVDGGEIKQLICRKYIVKGPATSQIKSDLSFRRQLWEDVNIPGRQITSMNALDYSKDDMVAYFKEYNEKHGNEYTTYSRKREKPSFYLRVNPGMTFSNLTIYNTYLSSPDFVFDGQVGFSAGLAPELVIPYTHKKLSLAVEPVFQYFNSTTKAGTQTMIARFYTLDILVGLKHYFYLPKNTDLFLEAYVTPGPTIPLSTVIKFEEAEDQLSWSRARHVVIGAGVNWKRFGAGFRYSPRRPVVEDRYITSRYSVVSFILSYRIF